jgi:transposase
MELLRVIRLWALRKKMPIREIARRTGLSRNTIKKYLRAGIVEPQFQSLDRPSKLDLFAEKLSGWLVTEQRKSRKERRTAKQMHADLEPEFCNPAAGWEKGQVEKNVRDARHRLWQVMQAFPDLEALNHWLEERCKVL